ncbi:hypothetical protein SLS62_006447 [Diatrype stigma]|uniref:DUF2428 domain-containing protein n=1 Tax=Diatrype stigma TaxID=117547 RepID=A0AAN9UR06_9PEZI
MTSPQDRGVALDIGNTSFNPKDAIAWIESQNTSSQLVQTDNIFQELLQNASKPKQLSGNTCAKLCGFVEQCSKSSSPVLRTFAFSEDTAIRLFDFYVEWNEQDSHRSMRLVLDYLVYSISKNPNPETSATIKTRISRDAITMITQQSSKPSIKSAISHLDHAVQKGLVYLSDVLDLYREVHGLPPDTNVAWDGFISSLFNWMELHYVCSAAGKLIVTIFTKPWYKDRDTRFYPDSWHQFIYRALQTNLELLEPIKLYVFIPLFRVDKPGTLEYLNTLFTLQNLTDNHSTSWDLNSMLWLAMLEAGKKAGVVDEPGTGHNPKSGTVVAQLSVDTLEVVLSHKSIEARSAAVSILITSPSTTRPYTAEALMLLQNHLPSFHSDTDPKFRYDVLGHSKSMIRRIQGAIESLQREYERATKKLEKEGSTKKGGSGSLLGVIENTQSVNQADPQETVVEELRNTLGRHEQFVRWYMSFLKNELVPTASYQRHITALKAMSFVLKSTLPQQIKDLQSQGPGGSFTDYTWLRCVLDRILDPFDDVREAAASLVILLAEDKHATTENCIEGLNRPVVEELRDFCKRAEELARKTARADHSDGVARSYEILWRWAADEKEQLHIVETVITDLERKLAAAESDLGSAVLQAPVHGSFASLRYLWGSLSSKKYADDDLTILEGFQDRAIACCSRIWQAVRHVLCDDSPEGHLPEELEEMEGLDTKDLLSYSFRAIHESSNLLRTIGNNARNDRARGLLNLPRNSFETIGRLTFDELSNLRHRGAFTTVTQTFGSCCQLVKYFPPTSPNDEEAGLLDEWYKGALDCIYTQASTTRRSAGIPSLVVGILSANAARPSFDAVVRQLREIAERPAHMSETDGSKLPQVHALNCLKDIFKSSAFSKRVDEYLTDCLQLAANSLKSEVWAIRNCGLLLLRSLIDCLFGTNESKASMEAGWDGRTTRISYAKFPALPTVLVHLLEMGQRSEGGVLLGAQTTAESVFPALDIIRRAGPPEAARDRLYATIAWYLGSRIWHVREIAARTLCSFLLKPGWLDAVAALIAGSGLDGSANKLHGALLTLKFLLERLLEVMPDLLFETYPDKLRNLLEAIPDMSGNSLATCLEARAVYVEILSFFTQLEEHAMERRKPAALPSTTPLPILVRESSSSSSSSPSVLLSTSLAVATTKDLLRRSQIDELGRALQRALRDDINVACAMLETLSRGGPPPGPSRNSDNIHGEVASSSSPEGTTLALARAYMDVCAGTEAPEPRALAVDCLAALLRDALLQSGTPEATAQQQQQQLPDQETLYAFWAELQLQRKPMSPSLSEAVVRLSGPLLAAACVCCRASAAAEKQQDEEDKQSSARLVRRWVSAWGAMMSDAGRDDRTFDTRMAAITALKSFSEATATVVTADTHHLPWLLAVYDALNDDDDEIRDVAAAAAAPVLAGQQLEPAQAAQRLLAWLRARYSSSSSAEFRAHAAGRMVGQHVSHALLPSPLSAAAEGEEAERTIINGGGDVAWTPAEQQLCAAMRFDDALFVVEEQNLYVDEVREAQRWRDVLFPPPEPLSQPQQQEQQQPRPELHALATWTLDGLRTLVRLADAEMQAGDGDGDGPLGWTSKPEVFAICARVVVAGAALSSSSSFAEIRDALRAFQSAGRRARVHGLLLGMCEMQ